MLMSMRSLIPVKNQNNFNINNQQIRIKMNGFKTHPVLINDINVDNNKGVIFTAVAQSPGTTYKIKHEKKNSFSYTKLKEW